jgi:hypothetical protein
MFLVLWCNRVLQILNAYAIKVSSYYTKHKKHKGYKKMTTATTQMHSRHGALTTFASSMVRTVNALVGNQHLLTEFSATAAHYDGLIDAIERAGWDLSHLEKVKHAFDETAESLLRELTSNVPDMSVAEEQSFLSPFRDALHQFARMTTRERAAFHTEYNRFIELHTRSLAQLAAEETA